MLFPPKTEEDVVAAPPKILPVDVIDAVPPNTLPLDGVEAVPPNMLPLEETDAAPVLPNTVPSFLAPVPNTDPDDEPQAGELFKLEKKIIVQNLLIKVIKIYQC